MYENLRNYRESFEAIDYPIWLIRQNKNDFIVFGVYRQEYNNYSNEKKSIHPLVHLCNL